MKPSLKVIVFSTLNHYYSPLVLKALKKSEKWEVISVFTTPDMLKSRHLKGGFLKRAHQLIKLSGTYFILSMILLRLHFIFNKYLERFILKKSEEDRKYISIEEICNYNKWPLIKINNVNDKDIISNIKRIKPDVIIFVFFNQIVKKEFLEIDSKIIHIHPSYLPHYRGISPVFWVLVNSEKKTGVTVYFLDEGIDSGEIILQKEVIIDEDETFHSLYIKCAIGAEELLFSVLKIFEKGDFSSKSQNLSEGSYYSKKDRIAIRKLRKTNHSFI